MEEILAETYKMYITVDRELQRLESFTHNI